MPTTRSRARGGKPPAPPPAAPSAKRRAKAPAGGSRDAKRRTPGSGAGSTGAGAKKVVYPNKNDPKSDPFHAVGFVNMNDLNTMWAARLLLARLVVSSTPAPLLSDADVPERGMPCAAHVRGPSIMRGHFHQALNDNPAHRPTSDAALLRAIPAKMRPEPVTVDGLTGQKLPSYPAPLRAAVLEACVGGAIRWAFSDVRMINNANTHQRFDPDADAERRIKDDRARTKEAVETAVSAEQALAERCEGDEEVYRAEAASCLRTPEQLALAAKIAERCAEYERGVRCAPRRMPPPPSPRDDEEEDSEEDDSEEDSEDEDSEDPSSSGATNDDEPIRIPPERPSSSKPSSSSSSSSSSSECSSSDEDAPLTFDEILPSAFDLCAGGAPSFLEGRWGSGVHKWTVSAATLERLREGFARGDPRRVLAECSDPADPNGGAFAPERRASLLAAFAAGSRAGARGAGAAGGRVRVRRREDSEDSDEDGSLPPSPRDAYAAADSKSKSKSNANANAHPSRRRRGVTTTKGHRETTPPRSRRGDDAPPQGSSVPRGQTLDLPFCQTSGAKALRRSMLTRAFNDVRGPFRLVSGDVEVGAYVTPGDAAGTPWHFDPNHNVTVQLYGKKRWWWVRNHEERGGDDRERGIIDARVGRGDRHATWSRAYERSGGAGRDACEARWAYFAGPEDGGGDGGDMGAEDDFRERRSRRSRRSEPPPSMVETAVLGPGDAIYVPPGRWHAVRVEDAEVPDPGPERPRDDDEVPSDRLPVCFSVDARVAATSRARWFCEVTHATLAPRLRLLDANLGDGSGDDPTCDDACSEAFGAALRGWERERSTIKNNNPWMPVRGMPFERGLSKGFDLAATLGFLADAKRATGGFLDCFSSSDDDERTPSVRDVHETVGDGRAREPVFQFHPMCSIEALADGDPRFVRFKRYGDDSQCAPLRLRATSTLTDRDYCRFTILCPPMIGAALRATFGGGAALPMTDFERWFSERELLGGAAPLAEEDGARGAWRELMNLLVHVRVARVGARRRDGEGGVEVLPYEAVAREKERAREESAREESE